MLNEMKNIFKHQFYIGEYQMKHLITTLIIAGSLASGAVLQASPGFGDKRFDDCQKSERHMNKSSGRYGDKSFVERMAKKLNFSEEQNAAIRSIVDKMRPQMQEIRDKMRGNRMQLRTLIAQDSFNEAAVRQLAEQQGSYKTELIVLRSKIRNEINQQLNETQRQQLKEMRERRKHKRY